VIATGVATIYCQSVPCPVRTVLHSTMSALTTEHVLYAERPEWSDVDPVPQYENIQPLAPIFYSPEYKDATDYFRSIVKLGEKSQRVLELTETIIRLNPAHYSAWYVPFRHLVHHPFFFTKRRKGNIATKLSSLSPPLSSPSSSSPMPSPMPPRKHTRSGTTDGSFSQLYATPCQN